MGRHAAKVVKSGTRTHDMLSGQSSGRQPKMLKEPFLTKKKSVWSRKKWEIASYKEEIETELENSRPKLRGIYAAFAKQIDPEDEDALSVASETMELEGEEAELQAAAHHLTQDFLCHVLQDQEEGRTLSPDEQDKQTEGQQKEAEEDGVEQKTPTPPRLPPPPLPLASILGKLPLQLPIQLTPDSDNDDRSESGELDLDGIDDKEIDKYILNDREVENKTALWMKQNEEYLREQREKEQRINKEKEQGTYKEKKKSVSRKDQMTEASSAGEAIQKMLEHKKISSKINYDVLRGLEPPSSSAKSTASSCSSPPTSPPPTATPSRARGGGGADGSSEGVRRRRRAASRRKKPNDSTPAVLGLAATAGKMGKRLRPLISTSQKKKKLQDGVVMTTAAEPEPALSPAPPPNTEPLAPPCTEELANEEPVEEEEEEEEEEPCVSALKLIGQNEYGCEADEEEIF